MKLLIVVIAVSGLLVGGYYVLSDPVSKGAGQEKATVQSKLTAETINQDIENGALLLDVRTPEEFATGYIENAQLFPLADLQTSSYPATDLDTKLYVYCRSGNRSAEATDILRSAGFTDVIDLGGVPDVQAIGGKFVS